MNKRITIIFGLFLFVYNSVSFADFITARPFDLRCSYIQNNGFTYQSFLSEGAAHAAGMACVQMRVTLANSVYFDMSVAGETYIPQGGNTHIWAVSIQRIWKLEPNKGEVSFVNDQITIQEHPRAYQKSTRSRSQ